MAKLDVQYAIDTPRSVRNGGVVVISGSGGSGGSGGGSVPVHDLANHTGILLESQAPWAVTDAELAAHVALPDAHHSRLHNILSSADHSVIGPQWDVLGLASADTLGLITPSVAPGASAAILRTDGTGRVSPYALGVESGYIHSNSSFRFVNASGSAGQVVSLGSLVNQNGYYYTNARHLFNDNTGPLNGVSANNFMASNDSGHVSRVPANGIYSLGTIRGDTSVQTPLLATVASHMTVQPAVDLLLNPGSSLVKLQSGVMLQSYNYASQTTGMRVTALGEGDFRYLFVDEMHAKSFIADLEQALAGGQIISKSVAVLAVPFTAPAPGGTAGLYVKDLPSAPDMQVFQAGDVIRVRQFSRAGGGLSITDCWGTVSGYIDGDTVGVDVPGAQYWLFTRSTAPNAGAMAVGTVIQPDAIVLDYGTSGNGFYEVNAIDGLYALNSPYLQFKRWTGHPATGQVVRLRAGQLRGLFGQDEWGLFAGTGTANTDRYMRLSDYTGTQDNGSGINNLPFRLRNNGVVTVALNAWNDVWFGPSSADKRLVWDGTTLSVVGSIVANAGYIGGSPNGWAITSGKLASSGIALYSGDATIARLELGDGVTASKTAGIKSGDDGTNSPAIWAGQTWAARWTAPFKIYPNGDFYCNSGFFGASLKVDTTGAFIESQTQFEINYGYKFRFGVGGSLGAGLTHYRPSGRADLFLWNNASTDSSVSPILGNLNTAITLRNVAGTSGKVSMIDLQAVHNTTGVNSSRLYLTNDGVTRAIRMEAGVVTINNGSGSQTVYHAGNIGTVLVNYVTSTAFNQALADYMPKSGGTFEGTINVDGAIGMFANPTTTELNRYIVVGLWKNSSQLPPTPPPNYCYLFLRKKDAVTGKVQLGVIMPDGNFTQLAIEI